MAFFDKDTVKMTKQAHFGSRLLLTRPICGVYIVFTLYKKKIVKFSISVFNVISMVLQNKLLSDENGKTITERPDVFFNCIVRHKQLE